MCLSFVIKKSNTLPKIIWTYWDKDIPDIILKFIADWKYLNPTWTLNVITKNTLPLYVKKSELPHRFYDGKETPQHCSDIVRVMLLYKYGGVWVDGSTIMMRPLDWVLEEFNNTNIHYLGYYMPSFTTNKEKPIIENWFMASKPNTKFLRLLKDEMIKAFGKRLTYIENIIKTKQFDSQNIPKDLRSYLWMHVIIQKVLCENSIEIATFKLFDAYKDAFALQGKFHWSSNTVASHIETKEFWQNKNGYNIIKLRNEERNKLILTKS